MRFVAVVMAGLLVSTGCASSSYRIPNSELMRLASLAPEQRAQRVLVSQEIGASTVTSEAEPVTAETEIIWIPNLSISVGGGPRRPGGSTQIRDHRAGGGTATGGNVSGPGKGSSGGGGGKGGGSSLGSGAGDGKAAAVIVVVLAAAALFIVAGIEGSRYDGWVSLHPMHPVHLIGKDGSQTVMPLAWIDPQAAAFTDKAIVLESEGPWNEIERKKLTRGLTYGMYAGAGTSTSATGQNGFGPKFTIQGGYFPRNDIGILFNMDFAWRDNQFGGTLLDSRYAIELQVLPLVAGPLHVGAYGSAGLGYRWEDVPGTTLRGDQGSGVFAGGGMLQLDVHTRIALTGRVGLTASHGDRQTDMTFGLSVY